MTADAAATATRTTLHDLTIPQRQVLAAIHAAEHEHAAYKDIAEVLGWTADRVATVVHSLPRGLVTNWTKQVSLPGAGLWPEGRTLAAEASEDAMRRVETQLQLLIIEGAIE